jgi:hypothetical protein
MNRFFFFNRRALEADDDDLFSQFVRRVKRGVKTSFASFNEAYERATRPRVHATRAKPKSLPRAFLKHERLC